MQIVVIVQKTAQCTLPHFPHDDDHANADDKADDDNNVKDD